jgi:hypothetical protein
VKLSEQGIKAIFEAILSGNECNISLNKFEESRGEGQQPIVLLNVENLKIDISNSFNSAGRDMVTASDSGHVQIGTNEELAVLMTEIRHLRQENARLFDLINRSNCGNIYNQ